MLEEFAAEIAYTLCSAEAAMSRLVARTPRADGTHRGRVSQAAGGGKLVKKNRRSKIGRLRAALLELLAEHQSAGDKLLSLHSC